MDFSVPILPLRSLFRRDKIIPVEKTPRIVTWKREGNKMLNIVRGAKVSTPFGEGIVVNLPIYGRISVRYQDGTIRFFFQRDVEEGTIKPIAA